MSKVYKRFLHTDLLSFIFLSPEGFYCCHLKLDILYHYIFITSYYLKYTKGQKIRHPCFYYLDLTECWHFSCLLQVILILFLNRSIIDHNVICYMLQMDNIVIHNFKGYILFIVIIKYWLYSWCCSLYPCSLFYAQ